jgi:hypothetical protein
MARLGALYAAQTGDTSQCVEVVGGGGGGSSSNMSKKGMNRNRNRDVSTSGEVKTTTSAGLEKTGANTTFCACVFETCGNGVWVRNADADVDDDGDEGSGEAVSGEDGEEAWEYVKACQKYCHAGTCV